MTRDDWFRSEKWDSAAQELFETKLARARGSFRRAQYLRIQGLTLVNTCKRRQVEAGRGLLQRVVAEHPDEAMEVAGAHYWLGQSFVRDGRFEEAVTHLRECLALEAEGNFSHATELLLAEALIAGGDAATLDEARELLAVSATGAVFGMYRWRIEVARARLLERRGDQEGAAQHAGRALELLANDAPTVPRHPTVGLIKTDEETVQEMRDLARA